MKIIYALFSITILTLLFLWWKTDFALPLFCTSRGCITTQDLRSQERYQRAFADAAHTSPQSETAMLTTLVRKHLIRITQNSSTAQEEAKKYRTDILHFTDVEQVKRLGFDSFEEYDNQVTIPFLLQQAYMNEHSIQTPEEAYAVLSQHFRVFPLIFQYTWDSSKGEVVAR